MQTLQKNGLKDGQYEVHRLLKLLDSGQFLMRAEISVTFRDVATYEKTVNFLVEKLESSVAVSDATFYVSAAKMNELR